jgi:hypothetical protein
MGTDLNQSQITELEKIEYRIAMIDDKAQDQFYIIINRLADTFPNNYNLGEAVRRLAK